MEKAQFTAAEDKHRERSVFTPSNVDNRRIVSELLQRGAYGYINARFDQMLERYWEYPPIIVGRFIPFYVSLLLAGVQISDDRVRKQVKQPELITVKDHTEQTVSAWLGLLHCIYRKKCVLN